MFKLSGIVTYRGLPLELGEIRLSPDSKSGNQGSALVIPVVDGTYETPTGRGLTGGAYIAVLRGMKKIEPTAEPKGLPRSYEDLFSGHKVSISLPKADHEHNFDVPE